jgi:hypothetical protein
LEYVDFFTYHVFYPNLYKSKDWRASMRARFDRTAAVGLDGRQLPKKEFGRCSEKGVKTFNETNNISNQ